MAALLVSLLVSLPAVCQTTSIFRGNLMGTIFASPMVVDRVVYVGSTDGHLYALL
jgi:outer membrane protein assembly factor BamB